MKMSLEEKNIQDQHSDFSMFIKRKHDRIIDFAVKYIKMRVTYIFTLM